jgi:hypothetical protein
MKAILLGAGASFGASRYDAFPAPLVTGILPAAVKLGLFDPTYAKKRHEAFVEYVRSTKATPEAIEGLVASNAGDQHLLVLAQFIEQQFGVRPEQYDTAQIDFEKVFALTEAELLGHHSLLRYHSQAPTKASPPDVLDMQIKLVLCGTLIAATRGLGCHYHDVIARWLQPGDLVFSFNYDLLMDRSLTRTGAWYPDDGYGISFDRHGQRENNDVKWRRGHHTSSPVKLLKPHGSLNWLYPRNSWDTMMNLSLQQVQLREPPHELYCLNDIYPAFEEDYPAYEWWEKYDIASAEFTFDLHTLLVPPSLSKPYRSFESQMGPLWGAMTDALLTRVEDLYIVGYSLRSDDLRSHWLLRKAACEGERLKRIFLVDPSDETIDRARALFHPKPVARLCHTIADLATMIVQGGA